MQTLSKNLKKLRQHASLSQQQVADAIDVKQRTYEAWENRHFTPSHDQLIALARLYGISIEMLVNGKEREFETTPGCSILIYVTIY
jgi:transcriptional regulator with XRE-family HTH domain